MGWVKRANEHVHETIAHPCRTLLAFDLASSPATGGLLMESSGESLVDENRKINWRRERREKRINFTFISIIITWCRLQELE